MHSLKKKLGDTELTTEVALSALSVRSSGNSDIDRVCEEEAGLQSDKT